MKYFLGKGFWPKESMLLVSTHQQEILNPWIRQITIALWFFPINHKNYNFLDCDWFKADFQSVLPTLENLFTTFVLFPVRRHEM